MSESDKRNISGQNQLNLVVLEELKSKNVRTFKSLLLLGKRDFVITSLTPSGQSFRSGDQLCPVKCLYTQQFFDHFTKIKKSFLCSIRFFSDGFRYRLSLRNLFKNQKSFLNANI